MNTTFPSLTIELLIGFFALLILTKVLGKTQITQLTPFDFISALVLGELVGNAIYDKEIGLKYVLYAIGLWGTFIYFIEYITQKWKGTRSILEGKPSIVIREGVIDRNQLKKNKLDLDQLQHLLRDKDVFSFKEVEYAILEPNGTVNVLKKTPFQSVLMKDLNPGTKGKVSLPISIISDGEWVEKNIHQTRLNVNLLSDIFSREGLNLGDIMYAEFSEGEPLYVQISHYPFVKNIDV
ncbi:DUF421 domain-containing protein [Bacillus sp. H-16]|uniref:DUF421 domain-containing protein n=1 Tax=Alteribacter keqinensis TaxID=2483800 RepID=A0A3M7TZ56_9BACI|nr:MULTISPECIES: DUF421 domain-containing protein [Alteribacter]MBM7094722.1 DUF421 domain-containing protein [Alteribacter salitolerans]RNA70571.1 DUF421 domain-containing protein [Alteribacter keqinensis]